MVFSQKQLNVLARYFDWYCPNAKKQFMEMLNGLVVPIEKNTEHKRTFNVETMSGEQIIKNVEYEETDTVYDMLLKLRHKCGDGKHKYILNLIYGTKILGNNMAIESCKKENKQLIFFAKFDDTLHETLEAVKRHGYALGFASSELKNDREIVLEAVRQNGHALRYASSELRNTLRYIN